MVEKESYEYSNGQLQYRKRTDSQGVLCVDEYFWEGGLLRSVRFGGEEEQEISYQYDAQGYLTRIDKGKEDWMEIGYESGNGNFTLFNSYLEELKGLPYIR